MTTSSSIDVDVSAAAEQEEEEEKQDVKKQGEEKEGWREKLARLFADWNGRHIITSPDIDGILCALLVLQRFPAAKLLGFYDTRQIVLLRCATRGRMWQEAREALWLDEDVMGNVRCIGQHLLQKQADDRLPERHALSFNPNLYFGQTYYDSFHCGREPGKRDKYPFGTIHLLLDYFGVDDPAQFASPIVAHADGSFLTAVKYRDNCRLWAEQMFRPHVLDRLLNYVDKEGDVGEHRRVVESIVELAGPCLGKSRASFVAQSGAPSQEWLDLQGKQSIECPSFNKHAPLAEQVVALRVWLRHLQRVWQYAERETRWHPNAEQVDFALASFHIGIVSTLDRFPDVDKVTGLYYPTPKNYQTLDLFIEASNIFSFSITGNKCLRYTIGIDFSAAMEQKIEPEEQKGNSSKRKEREQEQKEDEEQEKKQNKKQCSEKDRAVPPTALAIVGSRDYTDYQRFIQYVAEWIAANGVPQRIVSGGAAGVDGMARRFAQENAIELLEFEADWKQHGKAAGPLRNTKIVEACTHVLALPSRSGRGTQDTIRQAEKAHKPTVVHFID